MSDPATHETTARGNDHKPAVAAQRKADRDRLPSTSGAVDTMLDSVAGDALRVPSANKPVTPAAHAQGLIQQFAAIQNAIFDVVVTGRIRALRAIDSSEVPRERKSGLGDLLALAASLAVAGSAGSIAVWVGSKIASRLEQKFVEDAVKDVVKRAFAPRASAGPRDVDDLKEVFAQQLENQQIMAKNRLAEEWSRTHDQLSVLPPEELAAVVERVADVLKRDVADVVDHVTDQIVIAWTNFLARATHGSMKGWDFWERNGGKGDFPLEGAAKAPDRVSEDPTQGNVDPNAMGFALDKRQRPMQDEHFGILEVFVDTTGRLVAHPDYGMRLDNVGPDVRARLAQLGRVRDLKVNKVIRVCSLHINPPVPLASILITADGYVRSDDWSSYQTMSIRNQEPPGIGRVLETQHCMTDLIHGRETASCRLTPEVDAKAIAVVAERAQSLSLTLLEA